MAVKQNWAGALVVTPTGVVLRDVLVEGERIVDLALPGTASGDEWRVTDCRGKFIFPGLIDLLQHGFDVNLYSMPHLTAWQTLPQSCGARRNRVPAIDRMPAAGSIRPPC